MKNKHIRLVAMVLTLAVAFSVCAMPASASVWDENEWYIGMEGSWFYMWASEAHFRESMIEDWDEDEDGEMTDEAMAEVMADMKNEASRDSNVVFVEGTIPSNAYIGYSHDKNSQIYWYTKTDDSNMSSCKQWSMDWNTGTITYTTSGGAKKQIKAINQVSTSSGSSSDSGAVILLAGGAAVVAVVGLYLYTQPAVM